MSTTTNTASDTEIGLRDAVGRLLAAWDSCVPDASLPDAIAALRAAYSPTPTALSGAPSHA